MDWTVSDGMKVRHIAAFIHCTYYRKPARHNFIVGLHLIEGVMETHGRIEPPQAQNIRNSLQATVHKPLLIQDFRYSTHVRYATLKSAANSAR